MYTYDFSVVYKPSSKGGKFGRFLQTTGASITEDERPTQTQSATGRVTMAPTETNERTVGKTDYIQLISHQAPELFLHYLETSRSLPPLLDMS